MIFPKASLYYYTAPFSSMWNITKWKPIDFGRVASGMGDRNRDEEVGRERGEPECARNNLITTNWSYLKA